MEIDPKQLKAVQRLRRRYKSNETAYDALVYYLLTDAGAKAADVEARIKKAIEFCRSPEGEAFYQRVHDHLGEKSGAETETPADGCEEDIYEYSHEWAKAARHKDGLMSLKPGVMSPEFFAMQALSRFHQRI